MFKIFRAFLDSIIDYHMFVSFYGAVMFHPQMIHPWLVQPVLYIPRIFDPPFLLSHGAYCTSHGWFIPLVF
jgi:hypothetical protein